MVLKRTLIMVKTKKKRCFKKSRINKTEMPIQLIYRKEVSWAHRKKFNEGFHRKNCSKKVVSVR